MSGLADEATEDSVMEGTSFNDSGFYEEETASQTHPRCYSSDHVESLETFAQDLNQALKTSFPSGPNPYTAVYVLLFRWTEDDLGVQSEISALHRIFATQFHFNVEEWQIPSFNPTRALQKKLYGFQDAHQNETELLIVYYGGHAKADTRRGRSVWQAHAQPNSPFLNWSSLQPLLETAIPHVLIILDCCFAATAARDTTEGTTKEILAACGRESPTHGVGQRSFTSALIEEIQAFDGEPFTAAMLHSRLVTMRWRLAFTPIYALLSERGGNSITLCPLSKGKALAGPELEPVAELEAIQNTSSEHFSTTIDDSPSLQGSQQQVADTRVLLTVSVVQDAIPNVSDWASWLTTAAPWDVTKIDVQVHSIFRSYSTLVVVSIPTDSWDRLPERPAYRFVGFVRSEDIFQTRCVSTGSMTETVSNRRVSPLAPHQHLVPSPSPSFTANQSQLLSADTTLHGIGDFFLPASETLRPSLPETGAISHPITFQSETESGPQAQSINQRHKRQRRHSGAQPSTKVLRRKQGESPRKSHQHMSSSAMGSHHTSSQTSVSSQAWSPENDELLTRARQRGLNWQPIASQYFPDKTANACRKRHERLMEKRKSADNWDGVRMDIPSEASRHEARINSGHNFDSAEISDSRFPLSRRERSRSHADEEDGFEDSAIGVEDNLFVSDNTFGSSRDDYQQASYYAGDTSVPLSSYSSARLFSINSNASSSLAGFTPKITAAPQLPSSHKQPQTLPSFSAAFGMPSIPAFSEHPPQSPAVTTKTELAKSGRTLKQR